MAGNSKTEWVIDLNRVKAKDRKAFLADTQKYSEDDSAMWKWYAKTIVKWPFAGDPTDVEVYPELGFVEITEVEQRFLAIFQGMATNFGVAPGEGVLRPDEDGREPGAS